MMALVQFSNGEVEMPVKADYNLSTSVIFGAGDCVKSLKLRTYRRHSGHPIRSYACYLNCCFFYLMYLE
jgi:hypothetical protein